jgi:hypothetical protein
MPIMFPHHPRHVCLFPPSLPLLNASLSSTRLILRFACSYDPDDLAAVVSKAQEKAALAKPAVAPVASATEQ